METLTAAVIFHLAMRLGEGVLERALEDEGAALARKEAVEWCASHPAHVVCRYFQLQTEQ